MSEKIKTIPRSQLDEDYLNEIREWHLNPIGFEHTHAYISFFFVKIDELRSEIMDYMSDNLHLKELLENQREAFVKSYQEIKRDRDVAINGHFVMEKQLKEFINDREKHDKHIQVLIHNRDVSWDCLREILQTNEDLREEIACLKKKVKN